MKELNMYEFQDKARRLVADQTGLSIDQIFVVWFSKTLQNWKAMLATTVSGDGLYFEVTYNGNVKATYVDTYLKQSNVAIADQEEL